VNTYRVCGLTLASSLVLPELPSVDAPAFDCSFDLAPASGPKGNAIEWFHRWPLRDGTTWLAFGRQGQDYLLRFPDRADFLVRADGREIRCHPRPKVPEATIRHLLLDQVVPLVISHRGGVVLHASAVTTRAGAVAFVGKAGQGKSTLSASFSKDGYPVLADDACAIEESAGRLFALPSYPGLRLWPDLAATLFDGASTLEPVADYTEKRRLGPQHGQVTFSQSPSPIHCLYVLSPQEEAAPQTATRITPLGPRESVMALIPHTYHLDISNRARLGEELHQLGQLASRRLCFQLAYPRNLALLSGVRKAILDHLGPAVGS
jgi:hypothetical protein